MASIVDIIVNATDKASATLKGVAGGFDNLSSKAQQSSGLITAGLGALAVGLGAVALAGAKQNATMESSMARWKTLTGSIEGANKQLDFISAYAKDSPFDFAGVDATATSLMGMGMELETVNGWIPTLGDMASILGGGTETIKGVGTALGQMNAKGKVSAEEMGQLAERGVNAWQMIADGMGLSVAEVRKLSEEGKLLSEDALPMIQKGMKETFGGGTAEYMKSTVGQAEQAQEAFVQLSGAITKGAYDWFGKTVLPKINSALETLTDTFSGGIIKGFEDLWKESDTAKLSLTLLAGVITGLLVGALFLLAPAVVSAVIAFAPFLAIGMLVAGLAYILIENWSKFAPFFSSMSSKLSSIFESIKKYASGFTDSFKLSIQSLMSGLRPIWESLKELFNTIKPVLIAVGVVIGVVLGTALTIALAVFNGIVRAIAPLVKAFIEFGTMVANVVKAVAKYLSGDMKGASEAWKKATQNAVEVVKSLWNAFKGFFSGFIGTIVSIFSKFGVDLKTKAIDTWNIVKKAFVDGMTKAGQSTLEGIAKIIAFFVTLPSKISGALSAFVTLVKSMFTNAIEAGRSAVSSGIAKVLAFFASLAGKISSALSALVSTIRNAFNNALEAGKSAVSSGMNSIVSTFTGFISTFASSGRGLLESFTGGIKSGIDKAVGAVKGGMEKIRAFLPFSPAKKGALSDLDKSGKSFFPTWYEGALTQVPRMTRAVSGAMTSLNSALETENGSVGLEAFTGGRSKVTVIHAHEHTGTVTVKGDNGNKETLKMAGGSVQKTVENDVMKDLKQAMRKR